MTALSAREVERMRKEYDPTNPIHSVQFKALCDLALDGLKLAEAQARAEGMRKQALEDAANAVKNLRVCPFDERLAVPGDEYFVKAIVAIRALAAAPGGGVVQHMNPSFSEPKGTPDRRVRRLDRRALPPSLVQLDRERSNG